MSTGGIGDLDPRFRARLLSQGHPGMDRWLEELPGTITREIEVRGLQLAGAPVYGGAGLVVPVTTANGSAAVLKLVSPIADAGDERRALMALRGAGVVKVLDDRADDHALLLEQLTGPTLATWAGEHGTARAVAIAGTIAGTIAAVPADDHTPHLATGASAWREQLLAQHVEAERRGNALPSSVLDAALTMVEHLAEDRTPTRTHGDVSFANIMQRADGSWVAIDPHDLAGPQEHEAHTILRSILPGILQAPDPARAMADAITGYCQASGADEELARELSLARFVASFYWESQHDGDLGDVANLRAGTEAAVALLR